MSESMHPAREAARGVLKAGISALAAVATGAPAALNPTVPGVEGAVLGAALQATLQMGRPRRSSAIAAAFSR